MGNWIGSPILNQPYQTLDKKLFVQMLDEVGLTDVWHLLNPDIRDYTFYSNLHM